MKNTGKKISNCVTKFDRSLEKNHKIFFAQTKQKSENVYIFSKSKTKLKHSARPFFN